MRHSVCLIIMSQCWTKKLTEANLCVLTDSVAGLLWLKKPHNISATEDFFPQYKFYVVLENIVKVFVHCKKFQAKILFCKTLRVGLRILKNWCCSLTLFHVIIVIDLAMKAINEENWKPFSAGMEFIETGWICNWQCSNHYKKISWTSSIAEWNKVNAKHDRDSQQKKSSFLCVYPMEYQEVKMFLWVWKKMDGREDLLSDCFIADGYVSWMVCSCRL